MEIEIIWMIPSVMMPCRCLDKSGGALLYSPSKVCLIFVTCCILHNMCRKQNVPLPEEDNEDAGQPQMPDENPPVDQGLEYDRGRAVREDLMRFLIRQ